MAEEQKQQQEKGKEFSTSARKSDDDDIEKTDFVGIDLFDKKTGMAIVWK